MNRLPSEKEGWEASLDAERQSVALRKYSKQPYRRAKEMKKTTGLSVLWLKGLGAPQPAEPSNSRLMSL